MTPTPKKSSIVETAFFDALKVVTLVVLPLFGTLYFALAGLLKLPDPEGVVGGVAAGTAALGAFIKTNEVKYNASDAKFDGVVNVIQTDAKKVYQLALNSDPNLIDQAETLLLKVVKPLPEVPPQVQWEMNQTLPQASPPQVSTPQVLQTPRG